MKDEKKSPTYNSPLRARQKEQTAELILSAVESILSRATIDNVTISEVARVAEVTERTIYRHFDTRDELLRAFWRRQLESSGGENVVAPRSPEELRASIIRLFSSLDANEGVVRALMNAADSVEIRRQTNQQRLTHMLGFLMEWAPNLPGGARHRIASGIVSVSSVHSWMFMRDNCGYTGREAGEAAAFTVDLILRQAAKLAADAQSEAD